MTQHATKNEGAIAPPQPAHPKQSATWKFELLETVNADPQAKPSDIKLMVVYLHYADDKHEAFLSSFNACIRAGLSKPTVIRSRRRLERLGYLVFRYPVGKGAILYRIDNPRRQLIADHVDLALQEEAERAREEKTELRAEVSHRGKAILPPDSGQGSKNLTDRGKETLPNPVDQHRGNYSSREKAITFRGEIVSVNKAGSDDPFPAPQGEQEAVAIVATLFGNEDLPPHFLAYFTRQLMAGKLTPAAVELHKERAA